jgi:hypothetical protein
MRSKWREWRAVWRWSWIATGAAILVVALGIGAWLTQEPAVMEADCRELYAHARTAADTAMVDDQFVRRRTTGLWNCGMLRQIGRTEPRPHGR